MSDQLRRGGLSVIGLQGFPVEECWYVTLAPGLCHDLELRPPVYLPGHGYSGVGQAASGYPPAMAPTMR